MGKIVKYCSSCDEGFAERFGFCPDCGAPLQAFEMNPVESEAILEENFDENVSFEPAPVEAEVDVTPVEIEPEAPAPVFLQAEEAGEFTETEEEFVEEEEEEFPTVAAAAPIFYQPTPVYADERTVDLEPAYNRPADGEYHITVIQEKNSRQRNHLLLGATALMLVLTVGSWGVSLFQKDLDIGAIGGDTSLAYLIDEVPMPVEEEQKKDKDDGGGGGGGGKNDPDPASEGDLPNQTKNPIRPPDPNTHRSDNFELKVAVPSTEGTKTFEQKFGKWGIPGGASGISSGPGSGGGIGNGTGTGVGSGSGTGVGSGTGSGYGGGSGDGEGDGTGTGGRVPPPVVAKVTSPYRIISKPRAAYTDAARTNQVTGSVLLKVTLLASGQVGSITPVRRLPHGLTEQAIAAARLIRFEPKKVNGQPVSVVITVDYGFTIY